MFLPRRAPLLYNGSMEAKDKGALLGYLRSQRLMTLATHGSGTAACTVYYAVDDDLDLYIVTEPESEHCKNIGKDNRVACAIADSRQKVTDKKVGVQIKGTASEVGSLERMKAILSLWNATNPGFESVINVENIRKKVIESKVFKIAPSEIKFFNEELYGPEGAEVFDF